MRAVPAIPDSAHATEAPLRGVGRRPYDKAMNEMTASAFAGGRPLPPPPAPLSPRLLVAGHFVRAGRVGGAEPMLYNVVRGLAARRVDTTLMCGSRQNLSEQFLAQLAGPQSGDGPPGGSSRGGGTVRVVERGGGGSRFVAEQRACLSPELSADAVLFPNYYVPPVVPRRLGRVGVVMHDFQYRHFPQHFSARKRAWLRLAQAAALRRADRVIVISEFVRDDALRWFGDRAADKLAVVPNALCWERFAGGLDRPRPCPRPYLLSVAAQYPHKNLETLVRAFAVVARSNHDVQLVLCGQSYNGLHGVAGRRAGLDVLIAELGLAERVRLTGHVDDPTLAQWYRHAEAFAFPSVFEGFGMPPVEALGFGLPTVTTRATALPKVTLGLAETVAAPLDAGEWASKLAAVLRAPDRFRPDAAAVAGLRAFYAPARIAGAYVGVLTGDAPMGDPPETGDPRAVHDRHRLTAVA